MPIGGGLFQEFISLTSCLWTMGSVGVPGKGPKLLEKGVIKHDTNSF